MINPSIIEPHYLKGSINDESPISSLNNTMNINNPQPNYSSLNFSMNIQNNNDMIKIKPMNNLITNENETID